MYGIPLGCVLFMDLNHLCAFSCKYSVVNFLWSMLKVGGKLGTVFDEEPRRWRMVAEIVTSIGLSFELATAFFPQQFLILASIGNFGKALGRGMGVPSFRVIQQHFSCSNNVGEVAAKEEVRI